jgi:hypothetical protein
MKIIDATPEIPGMTKEETEIFLQSKLNLQLATIDEKLEPNIQPVWYYEENLPPKGVKGKGAATIVEDPNIILPQSDKISIKYLGTLDHPVAKMITDSAKKGEVVLVEISPRFFSTWDYSKMSH